MTYHTRTEKIGGDSIFVVILVVKGNRYDSLATPLGILRVRPILRHMLSFIVFRMLNLSIVSCDVVIMHKFCGARVVFFIQYYVVIYVLGYE